MKMDFAVLCMLEPWESKPKPRKVIRVIARTMVAIRYGNFLCLRGGGIFQTD